MGDQSGWPLWSVGRALFSSHRREADEKLSAPSYRREKFSLGPRRHIRQHLEVATLLTLYMHDPLGNPLAVEVREFLDQMMVLEQDWSSRTRGAGVLIVGNWGSAVGGKSLLGFHQVVSAGLGFNS
jgi:hypothetical protein